jgi:hypothetical protein
VKEVVPVKAVVPEREPAVAKAATVENMTGAKPAMEYRAASSEAAAMKGRAATMEAAAAAEASAAMKATTTMTTTTMTTAADFGREPVGSVFR